MKRIYTLLILVLFLMNKLYAQQDISLFTLNNVFQQIYVNPAYLPKSKVSIGLPVLSSFYINASNTGFPAGRFISRGGEKIDIDKVIDNLSKKNLLSIDMNTDLFSLGVKVNNTYFSFSFSERINTSFVYPKDFFLLIFKGNADEEILGKRADLDGIGYNLNVYHEAALGMSIPVGERLRIGARAKYLIGMVNITTTKSELGLTTSADNFTLTLDGDMALKTSGLGILKGSGDDLGSLMKDRILKPGGNSGFALDAAAEFYFTDRITLNASMLNLGYIFWRDDVKNYSNNDINYTFSGVDLQKLNSESFSNELAMKVDSLNKKLKFKETNEGYSARLNPQLILGGNLLLTDYNSIGSLVRMELISKILRPSFTFYYQFKVNQWLGLTANYSYLNKSLVNIGGGACIKLLPFQFYLCSDNVLAPLALKTTKTAQLRFGMNLAFGGKEAKRLKIPEIDVED